MTISENSQLQRLDNLKLKELKGRVLAVDGGHGTGKTNLALKLVEQAEHAGVPFTFVSDRFLPGLAYLVQLEAEATCLETLIAVTDSVMRSKPAQVVVTEDRAEEILSPYLERLRVLLTINPQPYLLILDLAFDWHSHRSHSWMERQLAGLIANASRSGITIVMIAPFAQLPDYIIEGTELLVQFAPTSCAVIDSYEPFVSSPPSLVNQSNPQWHTVEFSAKGSGTTCSEVSVPISYPDDFKDLMTELVALQPGEALISWRENGQSVALAGLTLSPSVLWFN